MNKTYLCTCGQELKYSTWRKGGTHFNNIDKDGETCLSPHEKKMLKRAALLERKNGLDGELAEVRSDDEGDSTDPEDDPPPPPPTPPCPPPPPAPPAEPVPEPEPEVKSVDEAWEIVSDDYEEKVCCFSIPL